LDSSVYQKRKRLKSVAQLRDKLLLHNQTFDFNIFSLINFQHRPTARMETWKMSSQST